jgi:hypothetical protein
LPGWLERRGTRERAPFPRHACTHSFVARHEASVLAWIRSVCDYCIRGIISSCCLLSVPGIPQLIVDCREHPQSHDCSQMEWPLLRTVTHCALFSSHVSIVSHRLERTKCRHIFLTSHAALLRLVRRRSTGDWSFADHKAFPGHLHDFHDASTSSDFSSH